MQESWYRRLQIRTRAVPIIAFWSDYKDVKRCLIKKKALTTSNRDVNRPINRPLILLCSQTVSCLTFRLNTCICFKFQTFILHVSAIIQ